MHTMSDSDWRFCGPFPDRCPSVPLCQLVRLTIVVPEGP